jgi:phosphoglycolate phosphatase
MKYKHIIWDWNGTLLNDTSLCVALLNESLSKRDIPKVSIQQYREKFLFPIKTFYESVGFNFENEPFEKTNKEFHDGFEQQFRKLALQPFAKETIIKINETNTIQSILSATIQQRLTEQVGFFDLHNYLDNIVGISSTPSGYGKEYEGSELMMAVDIPASETIIVGDSILDFSVSQSLGIDCALVYNGHNNVERLKATGAYTFEHIDDFYSWLTD